MPADPSQSSEQAVLCRTEGRVAILTINRPDKLNALNQAVESGMLEHLERLADDYGVGCLVVTCA